MTQTSARATHSLDTLAALHREDTSSRISLRGLGDLELLDLMEQTAGHKLDTDGLVLRDELLAETDGNPFFVAESCGILRRSVRSSWKQAAG